MKDDYERILEVSFKLNSEDKFFLLDLIARISEKSYRRAVQQVLTLMDKNAIDEWILTDQGRAYRYEKTEKTSIGLDGFQTTSIYRLLCEEGYLHCLEDQPTRGSAILKQHSQS